MSRRYNQILRERSFHPHCYKRVNIAGKGKAKYYVFKCIEEGCTHSLSRQLAIGRDAKCPGCGTIFRLNAENTTNAIPRCEACRPRKKEAPPPAKSFIADVLQSLGDGKKKDWDL